MRQSSAAIPRDQFFGTTGQQRHVRSYEHEACAGRHVAACQRLARRAPPRAPCGFPDRRPPSPYGAHDLWVLRLTEFAHRGRQVGRTDEDGVHPVDVGDLAQQSQTGHTLHLDGQRHRGISGDKVVRNPVPTRSPGQRAADPADAEGWVTRGGHCRGRVVGTVDHRNDDVLRADVEQLLDDHRIGRRRTHQHVDVRVARQHLQLFEGGAQIVGCVLLIKEPPVDPGPRTDLRDVATARGHPHADTRVAVADTLRPPVRHDAAESNVTDTVPSGPYSATKLSPGSANSGLVNDPDRITSPLFSETRCGASRLASQATPLPGWLSTAAATPDSSIVPLRSSKAATQRRSTSNGRNTRPPRTRPASAALSAMVSTMVRRWPVSGSDICTLASRISSAGVTNSVARNTSNNVTPGPDSSSPSTNANSTSTRGLMNRPAATRPPSSTNMSSNSAP